MPSRSQFWDFRVLWWKFAKFFMSFSKPQVNFSSNSASHSSAMKYNFSVLFLAQTCTLTKSCPLKCKFLRLLSSCVKICQILYVNFETASQLLFRFFIILQCHAHITSVYFQPIHFQLWTKGSHESTNFDIFKCSDENLPNLSCHFPITSQFFFKFCMTLQCTFLYFFRSNVLYFVQKGPIKVQIF